MDKLKAVSLLSVLLSAAFVSIVFGAAVVNYYFPQQATVNNISAIFTLNGASWTNNTARALFESTSDEFTVRVVKEPEEVKALLEVGFDYVCQKDNLIFMRKSK